jgi:hypothetical protein
MVRYRRRMVIRWLTAGTTMLACARHPATLGPGAPLAPGALITVIPPDQDPLDVQNQLTTMLQQRGFRVVWGARGSYSPIGKTPASDDSTNTAATFLGDGVQVVRSDYVLSYNYAPRMDLDTNEIFQNFQNFSATIVDLRTGALVAAAVPELRALTGKRIAVVLKRFLDDIPIGKK